MTTVPQAPAVVRLDVTRSQARFVTEKSRKKIAGAGWAFIDRERGKDNNNPIFPIRFKLPKTASFPSVILIDHPG